MNAPLSKVLTLPSLKKEKNRTKHLSKDSRVIPSVNIQNIYSLYTSEFANLDISNLKYYLESSRKGLNFWKSLLFEYIRRIDLRISAVCQTRKLSVLGKKYSIECNDTAVKDFTIDFVSGIPNLENFFTDIVESSIQGLSVFEINYKFKESKILIDDIRRIQNHLIIYDDLSEEYLILDALKTSAINLRLATTGVNDRIDIKTLPVLDIPEEKLIEVHSFDGDKRWWNVRDIKKYCEILENDNMLPVDVTEQLSLQQKCMEYIFLNLRKKDGLDIREFEKLGVFGFFETFRIPLEKTGEFIIQDDEKIRLSDKGFFLYNKICEEFVAAL